jgi:hypothetical protein
MYAFVVTVASADQAALTSVTARAADAHGYLSISADGKAWLLPQQVLEPFTSPHFELALPSREQTLQLEHMLVGSG